MTTIQYSTKLTPEQIRALKMISEETRIPQAVLVREAVGLLIEELRDKAVSLNFLNMVKKGAKKDKKLLKKLGGERQ